MWRLLRKRAQTEEIPPSLAQWDPQQHLHDILRRLRHWHLDGDTLTTHGGISFIPVSPPQAISRACLAVHSPAPNGSAFSSVDLLAMTITSDIMAQLAMLAARSQHGCKTTFDRTWQPRPPKPPEIPKGISSELEHNLTAERHSYPSIRTASCHFVRALFGVFAPDAVCVANRTNCACSFHSVLLAHFSLFPHPFHLSSPCHFEWLFTPSDFCWSHPARLCSLSRIPALVLRAAAFPAVIMV